MITKLLEIIFDGWGRLVLPLVIFAVLFGAWQADRQLQRMKGATHATQRINEAASEIVAKAARARDAVDERTARERLRDRKNCRDC